MVKDIDIKKKLLGSIVDTVRSKDKAKWANKKTSIVQQPNPEHEKVAGAETHAEETLEHMTDEEQISEEGEEKYEESEDSVEAKICELQHELDELKKKLRS